MEHSKVNSSHILAMISSVVDPKLFISDPDPTLTLISDPDLVLDCYEKYI
jgi:hypothetical protein